MDWEFVLLAIGTGAAVPAVVWAVFAYAFPRKSGREVNRVTVTGGVGGGRDVKNNAITIGAGPDHKRTEQ